MKTSKYHDELMSVGVACNLDTIKQEISYKIQAEKLDSFINSKKATPGRIVGYIAPSGTLYPIEAYEAADEATKALFPLPVVVMELAMNTTEQERAMFVEWYKSNSNEIDWDFSLTKNDEYNDREKQIGWLIWQAAIASRDAAVSQEPVVGTLAESINAMTQLRAIYQY